VPLQESFTILQDTHFGQPFIPLDCKETNGVRGNTQPLISTFDDLADALELSSSQLHGAIRRSDTRGYNTFALIDDRGRRRVISAPRPWLKTLQRRLYDNVLQLIPISDAVYNRPGRGVVLNAEQHLSKDYLTIVDVKDCFPSTSSSLVKSRLSELGFSSEIAEAITQLTTHHGFLPQGPPTSPGILDIVFRPIDHALTSMAIERETKYTRYMDDLAFSSNEPLMGLIPMVNRLLGTNGYSSNPSKVRKFGPDEPHTITKIVINTTLNPTPEFLRALYEQLRRFENRKLISAESLKGKIEWVRQLNPGLGRILLQQLANATRHRVK
jgi:RNA-directed DNA polymerase